MAVRHGYGKLAGTDALVFAYDTGDTRNSYRGEPTVNYISFRNAVSQDSYTSYVATALGTWQEKHPDAIRAYNVDGTEITRGPNTGVSDWTNTYHCIHALDPELNRPVAVMRCFDSNWKAHSFGTNMAAWNTYGISAGDQYTISWLQWTTDLSKSADTGLYTRNSSNSRGFWDGRSGTSATAKNTKVRTWQRVYKTFTVSVNRDLTDPYAVIYQYGHLVGPNTNGVILKIADVQLELKGHPTPFTGNSAGTSGITTRSATQGLKDLTGNETIDLSRTSFDSNADLDFDGTDDEIQIISSNWAQPGEDITVEAIIYREGYSQNINQYSSIINASNDGTGLYSFSFYVSPTSNRLAGWLHSGTDSNSFDSGYVIQLNTWYHVAFTLENGDPHTVKTFVNGVEQSSSTMGQGARFANITKTTIGAYVDRNQYEWNGKIPVVKIYNRALTAAEVKNNYNNYKGRFNL